MQWPDTPFPIALAIAVVGVAGFWTANNMDLPGYPRLGMPQWLAIPVFIVLLAASYFVVDWILGLGEPQPTSAHHPHSNEDDQQ